jgi:hypothetical protein
MAREEKELVFLDGILEHASGEVPNNVDSFLCSVDGSYCGLMHPQVTFGGRLFTKNANFMENIYKTRRT